MNKHGSRFRLPRRSGYRTHEHCMRLICGVFHDIGTADHLLHIVFLRSESCNLELTTVDELVATLEEPETPPGSKAYERKTFHSNVLD